MNEETTQTEKKKTSILNYILGPLFLIIFQGLVAILSGVAMYEPMPSADSPQMAANNLIYKTTTMLVPMIFSMLIIGFFLLFKRFRNFNSIMRIAFRTTFVVGALILLMFISNSNRRRNKHLPPAAQPTENPR